MSSSFNAINISPLEEQYDLEEYSREFQIEEGFKLYENALLCLNKRQFAESDSNFQLLFNMDIMKPDRWGFYRYRSPNIDRLRYLAFRNRGLYFYHYLLANYDADMEPSDVVNYVLKIIENLLDSIQHCEADTTVVLLLTEIFKSFKSKKLERLILEYELTKKDHDLLLLGRRKINKMLPSLSNVVKQYQDLLENIDDISKDEKGNKHILKSIELKNHVSFKSINDDFKPILEKIKSLKTEDEITIKGLLESDIEIENLTWEDFLQSFKSSLPYTKIAILLGRNSDPYNEVEYSMERINIVINETNDLSKNTDTDEDDINLITTNTEYDTATKPEKETDVKQESLSNADIDMDTEKNSTEIGRKRSIEQIETPKQRTSKRFRDRDTIETPSYIANTNPIHVIFFNDLESIAKIFNHELPVIFDDLKLNNTSDQKPINIIYNELYDILKNWKSWHSDIYNKNDRKSNSKNSENNEDILKLNSLLKSNLSEEKQELRKTFESLPIELLRDLIEHINKEKMHFHEVRFVILKYLLGKDLKDRYVIKYKWSDELLKIIQWIILSIETNLYEYVNNYSSEDWFFGLSLYEILVNHLGKICEEIVSKKSLKSKVADLKTQRNKLERKIVRLQNLLQSTVDKNNLEAVVALDWVYYFFLQSTQDITEQRINAVLSKIQDIFETNDLNLEILYPNYSLIPVLNLVNVKSQLKKINMIKSITVVDLEDGNQEREHLKTLESVLSHDLDNSIVLKKVDKDMLEFISSSSYSLKIKLWDVLFTFYLKEGSFEEIVGTYLHIIDLLFKNIFSDKFADRKKEDRASSLLTTLSFIGNFTERMAEKLNEKNWLIETIETKTKVMEILLKIFFLFYPILYFETNAENADSSSFFKRVTKSSARLKDQIVAIGSLMLYFFDLSATTPNKHQIIELIETTHSLLDSFSICDASDHHFLILSELLLCKYSTKESYKELKRILWCKYHFLTSSESSMKEQHQTKPMTLTRTRSLNLGIFLMKLQYDKFNPLLVKSSKNSMKQVLDNIIETIGPISIIENHILARNKYLLDEHINSPITIQKLRDALSGKLVLELTSPADDLQDGMDSGIFYINAVQSLNQYVNRKKSMQARPSELDSIIETITNDILYNTQRYESWYMLGKCFSYIVEDDLIWTADKFTSSEKKRAIALTQRKAIICYTTSLSLYYNKLNSSALGKNENELVLKLILEALGSNLMIAYYKPMDKICFKWRKSDKMLSISETLEVTEKTPEEYPTISDFNIEQATLLCFHRANAIITKFYDEKDDTFEKWSNYYYIAKILFKSREPELLESVFNHIGISCKLASKNKNPKELIVEPHYALVCFCYKLVKEKALSIEKALEFIKIDPIFEEKPAEFWKLDEILDETTSSRKIFFEKIIELLKLLVTLDKQNWQHRVHYRIANILFVDFNDRDGAMQEMDKYISLKSSKTLVAIWKPEYERPGKHFVYTYQYVTFYVTLLLDKGDFNSIAFMIRKIRRHGSSMAYITEAINYATKSYIACVHQRLEVDEKYIETLLPSLKYQDFLQVSENLMKSFKQSDYEDEYVEGLKLAFQLKKGSNGITFDSPCLSLYFKKLYLPLLDEHEKNKPPTETPSADNLINQLIGDGNSKATTPQPQVATTPKPVLNRKRVSKKEAFDRIKVLVEKITLHEK